MYVSKRLNGHVIQLMRDMLTENVTNKKVIYPDFYIIDYLHTEVGIQKDILKTELEALRVDESIEAINDPEAESNIRMHLESEKQKGLDAKKAAENDLRERERAAHEKAKAQARERMIPLLQRK